MATTRTREDTWLTTVTLDGVALGVFDTFSGGEGDSEEQRYPPGGMADEVSLGGRRTFGNVTIGRNLDALVDWPRIKWYYSRRGSGRVVIGRTPLSSDGVRSGDPLTFTGTLKTVTLPEVDSTGTDAAILELEVTTDGVG